LPGHPFDLGPVWDRALDGDEVDWDSALDGYVGAIDWPASAFWREISDAYPDAIVVLSVRDSARTWWESMDATVLPVAREATAPSWSGGLDLIRLLERFTGTTQWDDRAVLMRAYDAHCAEVRAAVPADRLLDWRPSDGWAPLCRALGVPVPDEPFPFLNRRSEWG
ncbi:MAG TPA: sulfotransferase, partial [Actinopolymorphaceae bacterium]